MDERIAGDCFVFEKPSIDSINFFLPTTLGKIHIRGPADSRQIRDYKFALGLNSFRPASKQHIALTELAQQPDGLIFTASLANTVISYISFQKPDFPWWKERCFSRLIELGGLETDPQWRKMGITRELLNSLFKNPDFTYFEDFITIAVHSVYGWDLDNTGLSAWAYRQFMIDFFKPYNFTLWETVDPEIREHPCNILLARVGANTDQNCINLFEGCCLGTAEIKRNNID
ncbi:MAG: hypothetical protein SCJ97_07275 [Bacillota bacterium]|nr:hypothetical protein [Bacillota bacterium]